jgi:hypothetical protein
MGLNGTSFFKVVKYSEACRIFQFGDVEKTERKRGGNKEKEKTSNHNYLI